VGAYRTLFTWRNYVMKNVLGLVHAIIIFVIPILIFQDNHVLLSDGQNADIWTLSLTSFTCLYCVVTGNLIMWTRWWTWVSFFFYSIMSICVYIAYMWFSHFMPFSLTY
jgi:hypothetical protein